MLFLGRMVPGVRTLISVPAGVAGMPLARFLIYSRPDPALRATALAGAGCLFEGPYERVAAWTNLVSDVAVAGLVGRHPWRMAIRKQNDQ